ncbi:unnamed protein product [Peronospora belbahrii]|uniref:Uncharacterized protein n=1 Tax=Peronospora belbahrii TaxID=622444 RepID=A0AAU9KVR8_9STRA|nr:unnamed protein product [Peronospora belbahrii]
MPYRDCLTLAPSCRDAPYQTSCHQALVHRNGKQALERLPLSVVPVCLVLATTIRLDQSKLNLTTDPIVVHIVIFYKQLSVCSRLYFL